MRNILRSGGRFASSVNRMLLTAGAVTITVSSAHAQSLRSPLDVSALSPIRGAAELACEFSDPSTATERVVQGMEVELVVTVKSAASGVRYALTDAVQDSPEPPSAVRSQHAIRMVRTPLLLQGREDAGHRQIDPYRLSLAIDPAAPPRNYDINLTFRAPGRTPEIRSITLNVGAKRQEQFVTASAVPVTPMVTAGEQSSLSLVIANNYPSYAVTLRRIHVTSEPDGLIDPVEEQRSDRIPPTQAHQIAVNIVGRRSLQQLLSPVASKPRLNVALVYDDGYRGGIERIPHIPIDFDLAISTELTIVVGLVCVALGAGLGAFLRIRFGASDLRRRGHSPWERVFASIVLAGVVVLLVTTAKLEIMVKALSWQQPLYSPTVLVIVSFLVAQYDPSRVIDRLRDLVGLFSTKTPAGGSGQTHDSKE